MPKSHPPRRDRRASSRSCRIDRMHQSPSPSFDGSPGPRASSFHALSGRNTANLSRKFFAENTLRNRIRTHVRGKIVQQLDLRPALPHACGNLVVLREANMHETLSVSSVYSADSQRYGEAKEAISSRLRAT